jgi:hypothetical protein
MYIIHCPLGEMTVKIIGFMDDQHAVSGYHNIFEKVFIVQLSPCDLHELTHR